MKVLMMTTSDETSMGIDAIETSLYSNLDSAWDDFLDRVEKVGGKESDLSSTRAEVAAGSGTTYFGEDVMVLLDWKEVQS